MEENCKKCTKRFRGEINIKCSGLCNKVFHEKCTGLVEYDARLVRNNKNIAFVCDDCADTRDAIFKNLEEIPSSIKENKEYMVKQEKVVRDILEKCNSFSARETNAEKSKARETYASQVAKEPPVILKPKSKQSGEKTKEDLKKNVDPSNLKISEIAAKQNGIVEILCVSEGDRNKVKSAVEEKLGAAYEVKVPVLRKPKLIITGVSEKIKEEEIEKSLKAQNEILSASDLKCIKVIKKTGERRGKKYEYFNAVVEMDSESFGKAMGVGKVNVGWDKCKIFENLVVKRCYKCLGFNHKSVECKNKVCCRKCCGEHDAKNCNNSEESKCANCVKTNERLELNLDINRNTIIRAQCILRNWTLSVSV